MSLGNRRQRERENREESIDEFSSIFRYLNDLYSLECKGNTYSWEQPTIRGTPPAERESHSCVFYRGQTENRPKLLVYGGMNGHRLGDLWSFHLGTKKINLNSNKF